MNDKEIAEIEDKDYIIRRLQEEHVKMNEELKVLSNKLIDYTNLINHMKMTMDFISDKIKLDIFI